MCVAHTSRGHATPQLGWRGCESNGDGKERAARPRLLPLCTTQNLGGPWPGTQHATPEMLSILEVSSWPALGSPKCRSEKQKTQSNPAPMDHSCFGVWGSWDQVELCSLHGKLFGLAQEFSNPSFRTRATLPQTHRAYSQLLTPTDERIQNHTKRGTHARAALGT